MADGSTNDKKWLASLVLGIWLLYSTLNMNHPVGTAVKSVDSTPARGLNHRQFINKIWMLNILI
jgi:hypothetical protein